MNKLMMTIAMWLASSVALAHDAPLLDGVSHAAAHVTKADLLLLGAVMVGAGIAVLARRRQLVKSRPDRS